MLCTARFRVSGFELEGVCMVCTCMSERVRVRRVPALISCVCAWLVCVSVCVCAHVFVCVCSHYSGGRREQGDEGEGVFVAHVQHFPSLLDWKVNHNETIHPCFLAIRSQPVHTAFVPDEQGAPRK